MSTDSRPGRPNRAHQGRLDALGRRLYDVRIREHLRRTEAALRATEHGDHTDAQRRRREAALDRLADYRRRGAFPANRSEPRRTPLFVGSDDVPCAMAHLLLEDGRRDIVADVVDEDPTVAVEDLPDDHPVIEWAAENGLTREEAARIQPTYPEGVQFATTCGSVPCWVAGALATVVGAGVFAASE